MEVFSVCIYDIHGEGLGELFSKIKVTNGLGPQYIYYREKENYESIHPCDFALLTGPVRAISAYGSVNIELDLMQKEWYSSSDEARKGQIWWNVDDPTNEYDKLLCGELHSKYGFATVNYAVLSDAVEATLEVTLINGDKESPADVYGVLTTRNGISESELFRKSQNEKIKVHPGHRIPLSRSVVAVPLNFSLIVWAYLWDHYLSTPFGKIANDIAVFPAQLSGNLRRIFLAIMVRSK